MFSRGDEYKQTYFMLLLLAKESIQIVSNVLWKNASITISLILISEEMQQNNTFSFYCTIECRGMPKLNYIIYWLHSVVFVYCNLIVNVTTTSFFKNISFLIVFLVLI